jgi:hypothetical protein
MQRQRRSPHVHPFSQKKDENQKTHQSSESLHNDVGRSADLQGSAGRAATSDSPSWKAMSRFSHVLGPWIRIKQSSTGTKLLGELAWLVATSEKCCDFCCDLDPENHSVLPTLLRRCDLPGDHTQVRPRRRPRFLVIGSSNLKPKIDLKYLPIPELTFCNPSKLEILRLE